MRKPRNYYVELKALTAKAKLLQDRKLRQLGELVVATGAGALPIEQLAGALAEAAEANTATKEGWRKRGAAFFQGAKRDGDRASRGSRGTQAGDGGATSAASQDRA